MTRPTVVRPTLARLTLARLLAVALWGALVAASDTLAAAPLPVVVSFSILGDWVREVGGERVKVVTLVGADSDPHVYEPTPADARALAQARLIVVNGLGFEGWLDRLIKASGTEAQLVVASAGVPTLTHGAGRNGGSLEPVHSGHETADRARPGSLQAAEVGAADDQNVDPHAWHDVRNAMVYVDNIATALCEVDSAGCVEYHHNAAQYRRELGTLDADIRVAIDTIPPERRRVVAAHGAFGYYTHAYGIVFLSPQGLSTEAEASAADIVRIIDQIRGTGASGLFVENIGNPRLIEQIARETGVQLGGELYSDALGTGDASSYIELMRHNTQAITAGVLTSE